ncbi:MAG: MBL fold metallo-hydrolase [Ardenticatenia bacterium]|nr:MBL fold metallo-hydrolase [Ardenticatenia bacterium]
MEVGVAGRRLILDAGLGIIPLGRQSRPSPEEPFVLLLTHLHRDHIEGLGFFAPIRYPDAHLVIYGPAPPEGSLEEFLRAQFSPPLFPLPWDENSARRDVIEIHDGGTLLWEPDTPLPQYVPPDAVAPSDHDIVLVRIMHSWAHPQGVFLFRVEWNGRAFVYATDVEGYVGADQQLIHFAHKADVIVHDAQYTMAEYTDPVRCRQGWGHSTPEMAIEVAQAASIPCVILFHHDPQHDDDFLLAMEAEAQQRFPATFVAREQMMLALTASGTVEHLAVP